MKIKIALLIILFSFSQLSIASSGIRARVIFVGTYGNGDLYIYTNEIIDEPGCDYPLGDTRIDVASSHPEIKNWLAIATEAAINEKEIMFKTNGCYQGQPTLDNTRDSYLLLWGW